MGTVFGFTDSADSRSESIHSSPQIRMPPPPPGPAPEVAGVAGASLRSLLGLWELLPREAGGPALAILLTLSILLTTLALYIAVCVAVFALF